jgi:hypothetical protein
MKQFPGFSWHKCLKEKAKSTLQESNESVYLETSDYSWLHCLRSMRDPPNGSECVPSEDGSQDAYENLDTLAGKRVI